MPKHNIANQIARDRGPAGFWALVAALPGLAAALAFLYLAYDEVVHNNGLEKQGGAVVVGGMALFAYLFWIIARWSYDSVHAALTPQRLQAMWLRRFQTEKSERFRPSREIDRLSRYGISSLTLQDRDVQLSFEQRRNRFAPFFWLFFVPSAAAVAIFGNQMLQQAIAQFRHPQLSPDLHTAVGQIIGNFFAELVVLALVLAVIILAALASVLLIMAFAAVSGPVGAMISRNRDDFPQLPLLLDRIRHGRRAKGAVILRIGDRHWKDAVASSLGVADAAIIDLTNVTGNIAWEIDQAAKTCTRAGLVFIRRESAAPMSREAAQVLAHMLGQAPQNNEIISYPASPGAKARAFARRLRQAIYAAADRRANAAGAV